MHDGLVSSSRLSLLAGVGTDLSGKSSRGESKAPRDCDSVQFSYGEMLRLSPLSEWTRYNVNWGAFGWSAPRETEEGDRKREKG